MATAKKRNSTIDVMKGLGILLVLLGHSINNNGNILYNIIYSFHMPLFFFVAGYVVTKWRWNKTIYLLVPHIFIDIGVWLLPYIPKSSGYGINAIFYNAGDWFFWTMFVVLLLMSFIIGKKWFIALLIVAILWILPSTGSDILMIHEIQWYFPITLLGYLIAKYGIKNWWVISSAAMYIPAMYLTHWQGGWTHTALITIVENWKVYGERIVQALCGIALVACIAYVCRNWKPLQWFGQYSLGLYATNFIFLYAADKLGIVIGFLLATLLGVGMVLLLRRVKYLNKWIPHDFKISATS